MADAAPRSASPPPLPARPVDAHKGAFGRLLIVAGSRDMPGAAALAALGALRAGAGLVTLASPQSALPRIAPLIPCATLHPLPESTKGRISRGAARAILARAEEADVVVLGPGLGLDDEVRRISRTLATDLELPLVIDADGLNALVGSEVLEHREARTVLTPHPGEIARLFDEPTPADDRGRMRRATDAARRFHATVVLKGARSVVTDGQTAYVNDTGNPGMATGGSGDVLAGITGAMLALYADALPAAIAAVMLHGLAGDLAAEARSQESMIATDLLDHLGAAFRAYRARFGEPAD